VVSFDVFLANTLAILIATGSTLAATVDERLVACLACHGENGASSLPDVPSLGAQPVFYLSAQFVMFRENIRMSEPMNGMLKGVPDEQLRRMAQALANLPAPPPTPGPASSARSEKARALIEQHRCNFCHRHDFSGEQSAPRLARQREDYLVKALRAYKDNTRRAYDTSMADVMSALTDADILDLAHYLSRLQ
jgi:cytochrome c553